MPTMRMIQLSTNNGESTAAGVSAAGSIIVSSSNVLFREQDLLKARLVEIDSPEVLSWRSEKGKFDLLRFIAGVDISFDKNDPTKACAAMTVLSFPSLEIVRATYVRCEMTEPYETGFLAFREVPHLIRCLQMLEGSHPHYLPQVILVDGNGILHRRGFGLASHFGVLSGIPTIGVGKKLHSADGIEAGERHKQQIRDELTKKGDMFDLVSNSGKVLGRAIRTGKAAVNPIYVSIGHNISLETASELVLACSIYRIPEPVRQVSCAGWVGGAPC